MKYKMSPGERYGRLITLFQAPNRGERTTWACRCDCGTEKVVMTTHLRSGDIVSCGCFNRDQFAALTTKHGYARRCGKKTAEYRIWSGIITRCCNPANTAYHRYGGRGITICDAWRESFPAFLQHMGLRPSPAHSVERLDNNGNYEPGNCVWATTEQQSNNRSTTRRLLFNGELLSIKQISKHSIVQYATLIARLRLGWDLHSAVSTPASPMSRQARATTPLSKPLPARRFT